MIVAAPASAGWKTHPAPQFERAVIALRAIDHQAVHAHRTLTGVERRQAAVRARLRQTRAAERQLLAGLRAAPPERLVVGAALLVDASHDRIALQRELRGLADDLAYARTLAAKAAARRGVVLAGLDLPMRARVLRAERQLRRAAAARRADDAGILEPVGIITPEPEAARPAASGVGAIAAAYALTQLGVPYRAAGMSPADGFDCSGLLYWAFAQAGLDIPRSSGDIWRAGQPVPRRQAQPGDLVSFHGQGHVGLYLGHGLYVHSTKAGDVVKVHAIADRTDLDGFVRLR